MTRSPRRHLRRADTAAAVFRWAPLAVVVGFFGLRFVDQDTYDALVMEDGPVEWASFAVYVVAALVALLVVRRMQRRQQVLWALLYVVVAAAFVFIASEEISWGQRQLGFAGPDVLVENNKQSEANLHNLLSRYRLHLVYILVGLYGAGVGRALVRRVRPLREWTWLLTPPPWQRWYFGVVVLVYGWFDYMNPLLERLFGPGVNPKAAGLSRLQEVAELALGIGFLLFVLGVAARAKADADAGDDERDLTHGADRNGPAAGAPGRGPGSGYVRATGRAGS